MIDKEKLLGNGSFGIVYEGSFDGNPVAVKKILLDKVGREVDLHKELNHENVLKLLHVDVEQDNLDFKYFLIRYLLFKYNRQLKFNEMYRLQIPCP